MRRAIEYSSKLNNIKNLENIAPYFSFSANRKVAKTRQNYQIYFSGSASELST